MVSLVRRRWAPALPGLWAMALLLIGLVLCALSVSIGPATPDVTAPDVSMANALHNTIVWDIRLPRTLGAWLVGGLLGLAGALAQTLFRNPLADPYLLGSSAGAGLGVALFLVGLASWPNAEVFSALGLSASAFVGSLLALLLTLVMSKGAENTLRLLLAGVVVGILLGACTSFLTNLHPDVLRSMQGFLLGSTANLGWPAVAVLAPTLLACTVLSLSMGRALDVLSLGETTANSLGVAMQPLRLGLIAVLSWASSAAVAQAGLVAFLGLVAPHMAQRLMPQGLHAAWRLTLSALMGATLLSAADLLARSVFYPEEMALGVVTALLGGAYLMVRLGRDSLGKQGYTA
jgi:iron complex transport system permease protein